MKKIILALGVLAVATNVYATWDPSGVNVTQGITQRFDHYPHAVLDGQGGALFAWETEDDWSPYDKDVAVSRISPTGDVVWSAVVTNQPGLQRGSAIVSDGAGGAIVVWFDERTTGAGSGIYAQRYDSLGVEQWAADGVFVTDNEPLLIPPFSGIHVVTDDVGGAYIVWQDYGTFVHAQRVGANGFMQWGLFGHRVTTTPSGGEYRPRAAADGVGGVVIAWTYLDASMGIDQSIFAQRFNAGGTRLWGSDGINVSGTDLDSEQNADIVGTGAGGAVVIWEDFGASVTEVRAQSVHASGGTLWTSGGVVVSSSGIEVHEGTAAVASDGSDGAFVVWTDGRNDPDAADLFAVHVLGTGVTGSENQLTDDYSVVEDATVVSDGADGAFVSWRRHETVGGPVEDLAYVQWLDSTADELLNEGGLLLFDNDAAQRDVRATLVSPGRFVVVWEDYRDYPSFTDCYARLVEGNTAQGPNIVVTPVDEISGTSPVTLTFDNVTSPGVTSLTTSPSGPAVPSGFNAGGVYYDITTNASFSGLVEVCVSYNPSLLSGPESDVRLLHYDAAAWVDITTSVDTLANVVCGETSSLSPFIFGINTATDVAGAAAAFKLHQNVPNPFNPSTTIVFEVPPGGAMVNISIYDTAGRFVRELVSERHRAGTKSVRWNGDDDRGQRVASGVYFYRMRAGGFVDTKKMVLLK